MIKFFRKYNKRLLAILVVGLMIVFLGGDAFQYLMTPNEAAIVIGEALGRPVTRGELAVVSNQIELLRRLGEWTLPIAEELDYLLLLREAEHEGLSPSVERARAGLAGQNLTKFSLDNKVSTEQIEHAMANLLLVGQMWTATEQSILTSELEIRQAVRDQYEKITADIVEIQSNPLINLDEPIAEAVLQEHFLKYREQTPTGEPLDFGYLVPDRVQVEYIKIAGDQITLSQPITTKQAETYWRQHKEDFKRPAENLLLAAPDKPLSPVYETFAEAREEVIKHLTKQARLEEARIMARELLGVLREPWLNLVPDKSGVIPSPTGVQEEGYYQEVLKTLADRLKQPQAISVGRTELFATADVDKQPGIGESHDDTQTGGKAAHFGAATHRVEGLIDVAGLDAAARSTVLSLFQTAPIHTVDDSNNLYLYRVIKVEKQHPPASLDEVRDRVLADVRALNAFNQAKQHAEKVRTRISADGLKAAWEGYDGLPPEKKAECGAFWQSNPFAKVFELVPGIRFPVTVSDVAAARSEDGKAKHEVRNDEFVNKAYELAASGGAGAVGTIQIPEIETCFVVQITAIQHLTTTDYETRKQAMKDQVSRGRVSELARSWFSSEGLRSRTEFKPVLAGS